MKLKAENSGEAVTEGAETEDCPVEKENKNGPAEEEQTQHTNHTQSNSRGRNTPSGRGPFIPRIYIQSTGETRPCMTKARAIQALPTHSVPGWTMGLKRPEIPRVQP